MAIIDEIRRSAEESNSIVLKQKKLTAHLDKTLIFEFFKGESTEKYENISVKDIISLGRNDHWESEYPTWIELLNKWIDGTPWRDEVIEYFENDIENKKFPAEGAKEELKLVNFGGLLHCFVGNHRIVGAVCWLVSKYGDEAILKKVSVTTYPLNDYFKQLLEIVKDDDEIYLLMEQVINGQHNKAKDSKYVKIVNRKLNYINFYELKDDNFVNIGSLKYKYFVINFINNSLQKRDIEMKSLGNYINKIWTPMNKHYFEIMKTNLRNETTAEV